MPDASAASRHDSTVRALLALARETVVMFWRYPDKMIGAAAHHYLGDPEKAKRLIEEMREADRGR